MLLHKHNWTWPEWCGVCVIWPISLFKMAIFHIILNNTQFIDKLRKKKSADWLILKQIIASLLDMKQFKMSLTSTTQKVPIVKSCWCAGSDFALCCNLLPNISNQLLSQHFSVKDLTAALLEMKNVETSTSQMFKLKLNITYNETLKENRAGKVQNFTGEPYNQDRKWSSQTWDQQVMVILPVVIQNHSLYRKEAKPEAGLQVLNIHHNTIYS